MPDRVRDAAEILADVKAWLQAHVDIGASLHQEPYKSDLYKLCYEAHEAGYHHFASSPRLSADALLVAISAQWSPYEDTNRLKGLKELCAMWREWLYALDRC